MPFLCCNAASCIASIPGSGYLPDRHVSRLPAARPEFRMLRTGALPMLDVAFLVIGAVFLGVCGLYALACDHL
jgi:hypothetical protein